MGYDSERFKIKHVLGPILATFASALIKVTASATVKSGTSANVTDRIKFFQNIKVLGMRTITRSCAMLTGAVSDHNLRIMLSDGTKALASCSVGTAAGITTDGGVNSTAAYTNANAQEQLQFKIKATGDGTAGTFDEVSADVYIEYRHRVAES